MVKMKSSLQYISDIHLERQSTFPKIEPSSRNIALIGDIGNPFKSNYIDFLVYNSYYFERVFLIAGNHEYYIKGKCYDSINHQINKVIEHLPNVEFLNNSQTTLNDHIVIGCTLWTPYVYLGNYYNMSNFHNESVNFLKNTITTNNTKTTNTSNTLNNNTKTTNTSNTNTNTNTKNNNIIVLTHYLPSFNLITSNFQTKQWKYLHNKYASNLEYLIISPVKAWLCGHSHCVYETHINDVFCGINSLGYSEYQNTSNKVINLN
jgi:hypothetical protein